MVQLATDLWVVAQPLVKLGVHVGTRMTVVRLSNGRLWLHSPVACQPERLRDLAPLGPVAFLVAPNKVHHLFLAEWADAFPEATVYGAPGLREKRRDIIFHRQLADTPPDDWAVELDQALMEGSESLNEVAFLHRASRTLILTDMAMNWQETPDSWSTRLWLRAMGLSREFATSRLVKQLVRDRAAARRCARRVLGWDFDRVIVGHGQVLERDGRRALQQAWSWLDPD